MSGLEDKIIPALISAVVAVIGYRFTQKKDHEKNKSEEQGLLIKEYGNPFEKINQLLDEKDELMKEKNAIHRDFDNFSSISNAKILELERKLEEVKRQLREANKKISELLSKIKEFSGENA